MDFILGAAMRRVNTTAVQLAYDIICQYSRNLYARMRTVEKDSFIYPGARALLDRIDLTFGIGKFHLPGHKERCQEWLNLAYILYACLNDGEASERAWAGLNPAASSFREMGPGTMRDTIDFFCGFWNWRKYVGMGESCVWSGSIKIVLSIVARAVSAAEAGAGHQGGAGAR